MKQQAIVLAALTDANVAVYFCNVKYRALERLQGVPLLPQLCCHVGFQGEVPGFLPGVQDSRRAGF